MSDILYRPNLGYTKSYETTGAFSDDTTTTSTPSTDTTEVDTLQNDVDTIDAVLYSVPANVANSVRTVLSGVRDLIAAVDPDAVSSTTPVSGTTVVVTTDETKSTSPGDLVDSDSATPTNPDGIVLPDNIFSVTIPDINVSVTTITTDKIIPIEYDKTVMAIVSDFISNLKMAVTAYVTNITSAMADSGVTDFAVLSREYVGTSTKLSQNLQHLSDMVIRSQIVRDQKTRLINKLFSPKETIVHLRSCQVARQLRERYYKESFTDNSTYLDVSRNVMLEESRVAYDAKYKENLYNLYKYLNSSVILISECLGMLAKESQAKAILIQNEGMK